MIHSACTEDPVQTASEDRLCKEGGPNLLLETDNSVSNRACSYTWTHFSIFNEHLSIKTQGSEQDRSNVRKCGKTCDSSLNFHFSYYSHSVLSAFFISACYWLKSNKVKINMAHGIFYLKNKYSWRFTPFHLFSHCLNLYGGLRSVHIKFGEFFSILNYIGSSNRIVSSETS